MLPKDKAEATTSGDCNFVAYFILSALLLGPTFFPPIPVTTLTYRRLYWRRFLARPRGIFFFSSCFSTLGVWPLTFPARARDPCTFPMFLY
jgi:hypothetical protein